MFAHLSSAVFVFSFLRNKWKLLINRAALRCLFCPINSRKTLKYSDWSAINQRKTAPENDWSVRVTPLFIWFTLGWLIIAPLGFGLLFGPKDESLFQEIKDSWTDNESNLYITWVLACILFIYFLHSLKEGKRCARCMRKIRESF